MVRKALILSMHLLILVFVTFQFTGCGSSSVREREEAAKIEATREVIAAQNAKRAYARTIAPRVSVPDAIIETRVQAYLSRHQESFSGVEVSSVNGVVTLSGKVREESSRDRLLGVIKEFRGVQMVVDDISIGEPPSAFTKYLADVPYTSAPFKIAGAIVVLATLIWLGRPRRVVAEPASV